jgi:hypothetical protein
MPCLFVVLRYLVTFCFLLLASVSGAQKLIGRITDKESGRGLYPVAVTNLISRITVLSEEDGTFSIDAKAGEEVAFTLMGYKAQQKTVPYSIGVAEVSIQMAAISYTLDEATVIGLTKYQKDSIYRKTTYARPLAARHAGFMSPFSVLAEQFSKKSKRTFKFQDDFYKWETDLFVDSRFTPDLVHSLTGLNGDTLAHFMNTNAMPYDYARAATDLELKMWIRSKYKSYMSGEKYKQIPRVKDSLANQPRR